MSSDFIVEALESLGYVDNDDGEVCIAYFDEQGRCNHRLLRGMDGQRFSDLTDLYVATGRFRPGSLAAYSGRRAENLTSIIDLPFDFDLAGYIGAPDKSRLHTTAHDVLDSYTDALAADVQEVMAKCNIPVSALVATGYGVLALSRVDDAHIGRVAELRVLHKALVERINRTVGGTTPFADPQVSDAGTRIVRVPGCINTKNPDMPRQCYVMGEWSDAVLNPDSFGPLDLPTASAVSRYRSSGSLSAADHDGVVSVLRTFWEDGNRHDVSLGIAALLGKSGVGREEAHALVEEASYADPEYQDRRRAVDTTYDRLEAGLPSSGFTRLSQTLPPDALLALDAHLYDLRQATYNVRRQDGVETHVRVAQTDGGILYARPRVPGEDGAAERATRFRVVPDAAFRGWFGDYCDLMQPTTDAPRDFHLAVSLAMAGAFIGRRAYTYHFENMYPILYTVLVGTTGNTRKTTSIRRGRALFSSLQGGGTYYVPFSEQAGVSTWEGLLEWLASNPRAMLNQDEFSGILEKTKQQVSAALMPGLVRLWDAPAYEQLQTRSNPIIVAEPTLSMLSATTLDVLGDQLGPQHITSGFANRILFVYGEGGERMDTAPPVDAERQMRLMRQLATLVDALPARGKHLPKTPEARAYWKEVDYDLYHQKHETRDAQHMAQRVPANTHRVAVIYATSEGASEISRDHMQSAYAYVSTAFSNVAEHAATWGSEDDAALAQAVLELVAVRGEVAKHDAYRAAGLRSGPVKMSRIITALQQVGAIRVDQWGNITEVARDG